MGGKNGGQSNEDILRGAWNNLHLHGDAKVLQETFIEFAKGGVTQEEKRKLEEIDKALPNASIQLLKDGNAKIVDDAGRTSLIKPSDSPVTDKSAFIRAYE